MGGDNPDGEDPGIRTSDVDADDPSISRQPNGDRADDPSTDKQPEGDGGAEDLGTGADNPGTRIPNTDKDGGANNPGIGRRPKEDRGAEEPSTGASDIDRADNPGICTPDANRDREANNPGTCTPDADGDKGADNPGTGRR